MNCKDSSACPSKVKQQPCFHNFPAPVLASFRVYSTSLRKSPQEAPRFTWPQGTQGQHLGSTLESWQLFKTLSPKWSLETSPGLTQSAVLRSCLFLTSLVTCKVISPTWPFCSFFLQIKHLAWIYWTISPTFYKLTNLIEDQCKAVLMPQSCLPRQWTCFTLIISSSASQLVLSFQHMDIVRSFP